MVKYYTILKVIEEEMVKCSQGYRLSDKVLDNFNKFHEQNCGNNINTKERALILDRDGNYLYETTSNDEQQVDVNWERIVEIYNETGKEVHITHNHPRGTFRLVAESLSVPDVRGLFRFEFHILTDENGNQILTDKGLPVFSEAIYPIKSISCESPNGARMTLIRGDNFNTHSNDNQKAYDLGERLTDYLHNYYKDYYETSNRKMLQYFGTDTIENVEKKVHKETIAEVGVFEKNKEFKEIQKEFRDINCKLDYKFPFDFKIGV